MSKSVTGEEIVVYGLLCILLIFIFSAIPACDSKENINNSKVLELPENTIIKEKQYEVKKIFLIDKERYNDVITGSYESSNKIKKLLISTLSAIRKNNPDMDMNTLLQLSYTIWYEGNNNGTVSLLSSAIDIYNKVDSPDYPDTLLGVIHQIGEYKAWTGKNNSQLRPVNLNNLKYFKQAIEVIGYIETKSVDYKTFNFCKQ